MEITKKPKIKSIPYDEFIDNESLEKLVKELNAGGANVFLGVLDDLVELGTQQFTVAAYCRNAVAASNSWHWVPRVMIWAASGSK